MNKADRASHLVNDDFFIDEISILKESCIDMIVNSRFEDIEVRESSYQLIRGIDAVVNHFKSIADQKQIDEKRWKIF
jgi:hypothetical protein